MESFGRWHSLSVSREAEELLELEWGGRRFGRDERAVRRTNLERHSDPVSLRNLSEVRVIMSGYPAHLTVGTDPDWVAETERFDREGWPLGTRVADTVPSVESVRFGTGDAS